MCGRFTAIYNKYAWSVEVCRACGLHASMIFEGRGFRVGNAEDGTGWKFRRRVQRFSQGQKVPAAMSLKEGVGKYQGPGAGSSFTSTEQAQNSRSGKKSRCV